MHTLYKILKKYQPFVRTFNVFTKALLIALLASCTESESPVPDVYNYIPLQVGGYGVYEVRQELYSADLSGPLTSAWQEKDQIVSVDSTDEDYNEYIVARFKRRQVSDYWEKVEEYAVRKFPDKILTITNNQTFTSLIFPIDFRSSWNGNEYNSLEGEDYYYENGEQKVVLNGNSFENILNVVERRDSSVINKYVGIKRYAWGVGLIYNDQISYEYCQTDECLANDIPRIESGYRVTKQITEFGMAD